MSGCETTEFDDVTVTDKQRLAALKTVRRFASDLAETALFAQMLGIVPSPTRSGKCQRCGHTMSGTDFVGHVRPGHDGFCSVCYRSQLAEQKEG